MAHPTPFPTRAAVAALLCCAMALFALPAGAQTLYGSITGTVTDAQGAAVMVHNDRITANTAQLLLVSKGTR